MQNVPWIFGLPCLCGPSKITAMRWWKQENLCLPSSLSSIYHNVSFEGAKLWSLVSDSRKKNVLSWLNIRWSLTCVIYSFNNAEYFMKCCTETVLAIANSQHETTATCQPEDTERGQKETEINSPEKRKSLQQHEEKHQKLEAGQDRTETKHQPGSASSSLQKKISKRHCKFRNMFNACYICGWCPQW